MLWFVNKTKGPATKPVYKFVKKGVVVDEKQIAQDFCRVMSEQNKLILFAGIYSPGLPLETLTREEQPTQEELLYRCIDITKQLLKGYYPSLVESPQKLQEIIEDIKKFLESNNYEILEERKMVQPQEYEILTDSGDILKADCYIVPEVNMPVLVLSKNRNSSSWSVEEYERVIADDSRRVMEYLWNECKSLAHNIKTTHRKVSVEEFFKNLQK